ncbi:MAG: hypothetical protein NVSMB62_28850 [Acidobacteriaceae bacterium]
MNRFLLIACLLFSSTVFAADAADPRALFLTGADALRAGKPNQAVKAFEASYAARPATSVLFWLGEAHRAAKHPAQAARYYQKYLDELPRGPDSVKARRRLARPAQAPPTLLKLKPPHTPRWRLPAMRQDT